MPQVGTHILTEVVAMQKFESIKWRVLYAGLALLALAIAAGAPGQYTTLG